MSYTYQTYLNRFFREAGSLDVVNIEMFLQKKKPTSWNNYVFALIKHVKATHIPDERKEKLLKYLRSKIVKQSIRREPMTEEEYQKLTAYLEASPNRIHKELIICLRTIKQTGCRISEIFTMDAVKEIEPGILLVRVFGKGRKVRQIYVPKDTYQDIKKVKSTVNTLKVYMHHITKKTFGYSKGFHSLRHTFATRFMEDIKDINVVSKYIGHSNVQTTIKYYLHTEPRLQDLKVYFV